MTETQVKPLQAPVFSLTPPEVVQPVVATATQGAVPLADEMKERVDAQLDAFISALEREDVNSDAFRQKLDSAFALGRKEIADATAVSSSFTKKNFVGETDSAAYKAISEMRGLFDELNPARQGDLFAPTKVLGIPIPFANKLNRYLRQYQSAEGQIGKLYEHIADAKDEVSRGVSEMGGIQQTLWTNLQKLEAVVYFINSMDERLTASIEVIRLNEPHRAKALEQEVLYYVRQNLGDVQAAQALTINAYNVAGELRKTGRELINGCDRVATLGMAALQVAVTLARATGVQMRTMEMLMGSKKSIEDLITATGEGLKTHVKNTTEFASNPLLGVQTLQKMFDDTFSAMDMMTNFRTQALTNMKSNNDMLGKLVSDQQARIAQERKAADIADVISV